jgi:hypothetical protein
MESFLKRQLHGMAKRRDVESKTTAQRGKPQREELFAPEISYKKAVERLR